MGGTDDPANLIALTIEEHADAHHKLYESYGKVEDKIAYLGLPLRMVISLLRVIHPAGRNSCGKN